MESEISIVEQIRLDLARDEGYRRLPYEDTTGNLTVGYGRNLSDLGVSESEARELLYNDIDRVFDELRETFKFFPGLPFNSKRALVNMCFNLGLPRLKKFTKMIDALRSGDYERAAEEALDSRWASQVGERADRIARMFRDCG